VVRVLALDSRFAGLNPAEGDVCLRAIKIRSTTSFGEKEKPMVPCRKTSRNVKSPASVKEILRRQNSTANCFSPSFSCFANRCFCW
jgi:hypothetical protein